MRAAAAAAKNARKRGKRSMRAAAAAAKNARKSERGRGVGSMRAAAKNARERESERSRKYESGEDSQNA